MSFIADTQTLADLNIPGRFKANAVYRIFDQVLTEGGRKLLDSLFSNPLMDADAVNIRCDIFKYIGRKGMAFPFDIENFSRVENYLSAPAGNSLMATGMNLIGKKITSVAVQDKNYDLLKTALSNTIEFLGVFNGMIEDLLQDDDNPLKEQLLSLHGILMDKRIQRLLTVSVNEKMNLVRLITCDHLLRGIFRKGMQQIISFVFQLDVNITVSGVAMERGFCYPHALPAVDNMLRVKGLYHPALKRAVPNDLSLNGESNVIFLTGANMAGKSTFMKSFGIATYLAHLGFPVAAAEMEFSVKEGLFSSINVPDDLSHGYSHFYAEVLRVKKVAEEVSAGKNLVVIFDELFKGTNVKDAYDATLAITSAFAESRNCYFIISTHIIEVGEALRRNSDHFQFLYLPTVMDGVKPTYTYQLKEGITNDRQGMLIIENEGIVAIIKGS